MTLPTADGFFGAYGGQYVPEPIKDILNELADAFERYRNDPDFIKEYEYYQKQFTGRPNPLYFCANLTKLDQMLNKRDNDLAVSLDNLRQVSENLRAFSEHLQQYPTGVLLSEPPAPSQVPQK